ncbi:CDGSH iron-sulfur domain-containing protein, partial [Acidithiobacillus ferrooxidans]|nr:CDGSH iron-sulfur domain-containing protein [Acidithiobacillus ferrooxidans]
GSGVEPFTVDIAEPKTVAICACHQSANRPFCDGTHKSLTAE